MRLPQSRIWQDGQHCRTQEPGHRFLGGTKERQPGRAEALKSWYQPATRTSTEKPPWATPTRDGTKESRSQYRHPARASLTTTKTPASAKSASSKSRKPTRARSTIARRGRGQCEVPCKALRGSGRHHEAQATVWAQATASRRTRQAG